MMNKTLFRRCDMPASVTPPYIIITIDIVEIIENCHPAKSRQIFF
jgi:hypothetical protein